MSAKLKRKREGRGAALALELPREEARGAAEAAETPPIVGHQVGATICPDCGIPWLVHGYDCGDRLAPDEVELTHEEILAKRAASCCTAPATIYGRPGETLQVAWPGKGDRVYVVSVGRVYRGTVAYVGAAGEVVVDRGEEGLLIGGSSHCYREQLDALAAANDMLLAILKKAGLDPEKR